MADHGGSGVYYMLHHVVGRMRSGRSWWEWLILYATSRCRQDDERPIMVGVSYTVRYSLHECHYPLPLISTTIE